LTELVDHFGNSFLTAISGSAGVVGDLKDERIDLNTIDNLEIRRRVYPDNSWPSVERNDALSDPRAFQQGFFAAVTVNVNSGTAPQILQLSGNRQ